jgi:hypothetical protein
VPHEHFFDNQLIKKALINGRDPITVARMWSPPGYEIDTDNRMSIVYCHGGTALAKRQYLRGYMQKFLVQMTHFKVRAQMLRVLEQFDNWFEDNFDEFYANPGLRNRFLCEKKLIRERSTRDRNVKMVPLE